MAQVGVYLFLYELVGIHRIHKLCLSHNRHEISGVKKYCAKHTCLHTNQIQTKYELKIQA